MFASFYRNSLQQITIFRTTLDFVRRYSSLTTYDWPSGSKWKEDHIDYLNICPQFEPHLNNVLPLPRLPTEARNQRLNTSSVRELYEFLPTHATVRNIMQPIQALTNTKEPPNEVVTGLFMGQVFSAFELIAPQDVKFGKRLRLPIGDKRVVSDIDALVSSDELVGFEVCVVAVFFPPPNVVLQKYKEVTNENNTTPQIAAHILGMAASVFRENRARKEPISVYLAEVQGIYFAFWKATITVEQINSIAEGKQPAEPIVLYFNRHRQKGNLQVSGYDFTDKDHRELILDVLGTYFTYALNLPYVPQS